MASGRRLVRIRESFCLRWSCKCHTVLPTTHHLPSGASPSWSSLALLCCSLPTPLLLRLTGIAGVVGYTAHLYFDYFNASQFTRFPKPVAKSLRRALYYTNIKPDPKLAHKNYKRALEQCNEAGLDPFSDEVLGIRIQTAAWLEGIGNYNGAITVLGGLVADCLRWVAVMEKGVADGSMPKDGKVRAPKPPTDQKEAASSKAGAAGAEEKRDEEYLPENLWRKRSRLLAKAVGTSVKLGELNADEHVMRPEDSQSRLTWAVETALKEFKRRSDEGEKEDEGPWMSPSEIGGALECESWSWYPL